MFIELYNEGDVYMAEIINKIIKKIKGSDYNIDKRIYLTDLLLIIFIRIISLLRSVIKRIGMRKCGRVIFVGKRVILRHKKYMNLGNGITFGNSVEIDALSENGVNMGNNCKIGDYSIIRCTGSLRKLGKGITIGNNFGCADYCFFGAAGGIKIGNDVIMGQNVRFHSENHNFNNIHIPIREQGVNSKGIIIEDDCWVGSGVVFLDGIRVGSGCVIGSNTLVNKDIPAYSIAVGNPVRIIKSRLELKK